MKLFCHFNEYEEGGLGFVNAAILFADKLTLWGPSKYCIDNANARGALELASDDIISLIEDGDLQIAARQKWFDKKWRMQASCQTGAWQGLSWDDRFDGAIASILAVGDGRVLVAPEETGHDWAITQLNMKTASFHEAVYRLNSSNLPSGLMQKLSRLEVKNQKVIRILQDARNHLLAQNFVGANVVVEPDVKSVGFADLAKDTQVFSTKSHQFPAELSYDRFVEMLRLISDLAPGMELRDLRIQIKAVKEYRNELHSFLYSDKSFKQAMHNQIIKGYKPMSLLDIAGSDNLDRALTLISGPAGLVAARQALKLVNRRNAMSAIGFGIATTCCMATAYGPEQRASIYNSWQSAKYDGPKFPFALVFQTSEPNQWQIQEVLQRIRPKFKIDDHA